MILRSFMYLFESHLLVKGHHPLSDISFSQCLQLETSYLPFSADLFFSFIFLSLYFSYLSSLMKCKLLEGSLYNHFIYC